MNTKNIAASVHSRLQNQARSGHRPFQELLQYYAMERLLYRVSRSAYASRFVLKGALMLYVWDAPLSRATKDLDFLAHMDNSLEKLAQAFREICATDVEPDGMEFNAEFVKTERIKEDADHAGVRVRFLGLLGKARVAIQVDVGFGDIVTPGVENIQFPTLLGFPQPRLAGYPRETVVAEKFQAMVHLSTLNSRMKDFFDIWLLARKYAFDGVILGKAIVATFANRNTALTVEPIAFTSVYFGQAATTAQWRAFRARLPDSDIPSQLSEVIALLADFLLPVSQSCVDGVPFDRHWHPGGPWTESASESSL